MEEPSCAESTLTSKPLNILIAEDESDIAVLYKTVLEKRNHKTTITTNGEDCLKAYHEVCQKFRLEKNRSLRPEDGHLSLPVDRPFDVVILDCKMPHINGIEVAKEILAVNPHQRIIFASAYVKDTVIDSVKDFSQLATESVQKPFEIKRLIDLVEDKMIYQELRKMNVDIDIIKALNPTHEQLTDLVQRLRDARRLDSDAG
ncbi:MAG: response regulator [Thermoproteota archaeon]|nr:response regulator [Thermoproteota archaeon]